MVTSSKSSVNVVAETNWPRVQDKTHNAHVGRAVLQMKTRRDLAAASAIRGECEWLGRACARCGQHAKGLRAAHVQDAAVGQHGGHEIRCVRCADVLEREKARVTVSPGSLTPFEQLSETMTLPAAATTGRGTAKAIVNDEGEILVDVIVGVRHADGIDARRCDRGHKIARNSSFGRKTLSTLFLESAVPPVTDRPPLKTFPICCRRLR